MCEDRQESTGQHVDQPHVRASARRTVLLVLLTIFGRCATIAAVESTALAASTLVLVQAEELCTALAHVGQWLPAFRCYTGCPQTGLSTTCFPPFRSVHGANNSVLW